MEDKDREEHHDNTPEEGENQEDVGDQNEQGSVASNHSGTDAIVYDEVINEVGTNEHQHIRNEVDETQEQQQHVEPPKKSLRSQFKDRIHYKEYGNRGIDKYNSKVINTTEKQQMMQLARKVRRTWAPSMNPKDKKAKKGE